MKYIRILSILPLLMLVFSACKVSDSPTTSGTDGTTISTTIAGVITDELGQPVSGVDVAVSVNGTVKISTKTNKFGSFMIPNASVPSSRCFILCKKSGYFNGYRAEIPNEGGITEMRLTMQSNATTHTVSPTSGGTISVGNAMIAFPANAFVTSSGTAFTGSSVQISAKFLDPTKPTFYNSFAGDMTATRTDDSQTELRSFGVLRVEIKDASGNELKLATGKTATLTYPIAVSMQKDAPASIPLWHFNETLGMWKEEGIATKTGNTYTGEVSHFSEWNCDVPERTGTIKGRVVCNGEGVAGMYVTVGQRKVVTDSGGYYSRRVPMNVDFTVSINPSDNGGLTAPDMNVTGLSPNEMRTLADIQLTVCPAMITGTIVDCNSAPVAGTVVVTHSSGYSIYFTMTGKFKIRVPSGSALTVEATTFDGRLGLPVSIPMINSGDKIDIGVISGCENGISAEYYDVNLESTINNSSVQNALLSPDGSLVVMSGYHNNINFIEVYNVKTGIKLTNIPVKDSSTGAVNFTTDGSKLLIHYGYDTMCVVNPQTGVILYKIGKAYDGRMLPDGSAIIAMDKYNYPVKLSMYSGVDGSKIKDLSYAEQGNPTMGGLLGSSQILLILQSNTLSRLYAWDFISDTKTSDITVPALNYYNSAVLSPDCSVMAIQDWNNPGTVNFFNTATGAKLNSSPFSVPDSINRKQTAIIGVANDNTFVIQAISDWQSPVPPTTYTIPNGAIQKILAVPTVSSKFTNFNYTTDSRYLSGILYPSSSNYSTSVRVWKLK